MRRLAPVAACLAVVAAALVGASRATTSPTARACPSVTIVDAALGQKFKSPTSTKSTYAKACTYQGSGIIPLKVEFQVDTPATFAASEKAAQPSGIVAVHGLGKAAWASKSPGDLQVFDGHETIKILLPLVATSKLEALARKLL